MDGIKWVWGSYTVIIDYLIANRIDVGYLINPTTLARCQDAAPQVNILQGGSATPYLLMFNTRNKPLDDARVRHAIGLVIDHDELVIANYNSLDFGYAGGIFNSAWANPYDKIEEELAFPTVSLHQNKAVWAPSETVLFCHHRPVLFTRVRFDPPSIDKTHISAGSSTVKLNLIDSLV